MGKLSVKVTHEQIAKDVLKMIQLVEKERQKPTYLWLSEDVIRALGMNPNYYEVVVPGFRKVRMK